MSAENLLGRRLKMRLIGYSHGKPIYAASCGDAPGSGGSGSGALRVKRHALLVGYKSGKPIYAYGCPEVSGSGSSSGSAPGLVVGKYVCRLIGYRNGRPIYSTGCCTTFYYGSGSSGSGGSGLSGSSGMPGSGTSGSGPSGSSGGSSGSQGTPGSVSGPSGSSGGSGSSGSGQSVGSGSFGGSRPIASGPLGSGSSGSGSSGSSGPRISGPSSGPSSGPRPGSSSGQSGSGSGGSVSGSIGSVSGPTCTVPPQFCICAVVSSGSGSSLSAPGNSGITLFSNSDNLVLDFRLGGNDPDKMRVPSPPPEEKVEVLGIAGSGIFGSGGSGNSCWCMRYIGDSTWYGIQTFNGVVTELYFYQTGPNTFYLCSVPGSCVTGVSSDCQTVTFDGLILAGQATTAIAYLTISSCCGSGSGGSGSGGSTPGGGGNCGCVSVLSAYQIGPMTITNGTCSNCNAYNALALSGCLHTLLRVGSTCVWNDTCTGDACGVTPAPLYTLEYDTGLWTLKAWGTSPPGITPTVIASWTCPSGSFNCTGTSTFNISTSTPICNGWPATILVSPG